MQHFNLLRAFFYFHFCCYWMCLHFYIFTSLIGIPIAITSSAVGLKIYAISAEIKKYKSIIKKNKKMHDKIVLLGKSKLDTIETLTSKVLH